MLQSPTIDPTRKPLTAAQAELFDTLQRAKRAEEKAAQTLDDLDAQHLTKARKALQLAREASESALLALSKALASNGHRVTPTGEALEVSTTWTPAKRTFCQPTWRDVKATTTHVVVIGDGKEAIKLTTKTVDDSSLASLGEKPIIPTVAAPLATPNKKTKTKK